MFVLIGKCQGCFVGLNYRFESRTAEQVAEKDVEIEEKRKLKEQRKREQEENVKRKQALKKIKEEAKEDKKKEKRKKQWWEEQNQTADRVPQAEHDVEWYVKEVGENPGEEFFGSDKMKGKKTVETTKKARKK